MQSSKFALVVGVSIFSAAFALPSQGADSPIELPSSIPVDVFKMQDNQRGIGYIGFNVKLSLEDDYFEDKIGDVDFESQGFIFTTPGEGSLGFLGDMYELSYTGGAIDGKIVNPVFSVNGASYNNSYAKDGFYLGIRPSYSREISISDSFSIKSSTTLHSFFYTLNGSFSVSGGPQNNNYQYTEDNYGLAFKPTSVIQATYFASDNFGLSFYAGLSTFVALDWAFYENGLEEGDEAAIVASGINPVYGYDLSYRLGNGSVFNISSIISQRENDDSVETVARYIFNF